MKKKIPIIMSMVFLLLFAGVAGAQVLQTLLPGALIPQFQDPLPVGSAPGGTGISVLDATGGGGYNITLAEFQAQILPITGVPLAVPPIPANTPSWVWGYLLAGDIPTVGPIPVRGSYLGPVVVAKRGFGTSPTYLNALPDGLNSNVQYLLPIDQTLDWADPLGWGCVGSPPPVTGRCATFYAGPHPAVPHIHGGEVAPAYDGGPDAWWTPTGITGAGFVGTTFQYPNRQQAGTIWFHDHALGITRLNVYAGMAGVHIITDPANEPPQAGASCAATGCLPKFPEYDIPIIIQDRSFDTQGNLFYNLASNPQPNPTVHPFWIPEFIGDTIVVNGKTWPFLNVEPRKYRLRLVNGSNARFYDLTLSYTTGGGRRGRTASLPFTVIATDDGYLSAPVVTPNVIIAPGERYEVIVDFTGLTGITNIIMKNSARTPFPGGGRPVTGTTDTVMQFRVNQTFNTAIVDATLPTNLRPNNPIVDVQTPAVANRPAPVAGVCPAVASTQTIVRQLTLNEVIGPGGPLELVLNNTKYNGSTSIFRDFGRRDSEQPAVGDTEIWEIINITADAHPIHTHLASFQLLNRQGFQATTWTNVYAAALLNTYGGPTLVCPNCPDGEGPPNLYLTRNADCAIGGNPAIGQYLQANRLTLPLPYENGWKDTVIAYPGEVTRMVVRWAETDAPATVNLTAIPPIPNCVTPCGQGTGINCVDTVTYPTATSCVPVAGSNTYPFQPY
ncbi:MAG: multicopper oxidase domain-containing protein, partial [Nitrospirota bacterium]|nr:multicopper oxidase domain-containing protein [Nitrospirota bacterium]